MTANHCIIDPDQTRERANGKNDRQRRKSSRHKRQTNNVRLAGAPIAVEQGAGAFPIQIARPMHARTRVENKILNQLCHGLLAENLHCALVHWQALSRARSPLDCQLTQSDGSASSLFRLMDRRVAGPTGDPNSERAKSGADRGERCAASRAFNGSSPTANLVSSIKVQGMS